jgi:hypothetical protein
VAWSFEGEQSSEAILSEELDRLSGGAQIGAPASASQLEQRQSATGRLAWGHFIGRAKEMAALRAAIDAALGGQASLVMVAGEPGIGKTRLAEEAGVYARDRGAPVSVGRCYEGESASPYSAFVEVIREYLSTHPDEALKAELGDGASDVAKLVPEIRKRIPNLPATAAVDPQDERLRLFDSVTSFLVNASKPTPLCCSSTTCTGPTSPRCCSCSISRAASRAVACWLSARTATSNSTGVTRSPRCSRN